MQYETGSIVVEFTNNLQEMERIMASVRRRSFRLVEMKVEAMPAGNLRATLVLINLPGGSDSFIALKKQLEKHIDVHNVIASVDVIH